MGTETWSPFYHTILTLVWSSHKAKGEITVIYKSFTYVASKTLYMLEWERDIAQEWDLEVWHRASARSHGGVHNISLVEVNLKVLMRWYLVPAKFARIFPSTSPICFRGCERVGTMLHFWWDCPKIRGFWNKIFHTLRKITGVPVSKSPQIAWLNCTMESAPKNARHLIFFVLLIAKLTIERAWKTLSVFFGLAKLKISWIMAKEKLVSTLLGTVWKFEAIWEPWAEYIHVSLQLWWAS